MNKLAELLESHRDELMDRWIALVAAGLAPGPRSTAELTDHIPDFVEQIVAALREPDPVPAPIEESSRLGRKHGAQRFRIGFALTAIVREYNLLLRLMLDLAKAAGTPVSLSEMQRLSDLFAVAMAEAADEHARRILEREAESARIKAQLEITLRSMRDGVLATDAAGRVTLFNPAAERLIGRPAEEAVGQPVEAVLSRLDGATGATLPSPIAPVLRGEAPASASAELLLSRADGSNVVVNESLAPIRDATGAVAGAVLVLRDETEARRKDAELRAYQAELEAERHKLHDLFMQAPVAIAILEGPQHTFTLANPAYRALVGGRDVVGKPLLEALPDVAGQGYVELLDRVVATAEAFYGNEMEVTFDHHAEGVPLIMNFAYTPKRDAEGRVDGVLVSVTDITEQVRARNRAEALAAKLRESEERLRRVVDVTSTGTWELLLPGPQLTADAGHIRLLGLAPGAVPTLQSVLDAMPAEDGARVTSAVEAAFAGEEGGRFIVEHRVRSNGPLRWIEGRGHVLFDAAGEPTHLIGTSVDITARKEAEAAQQRLLEEVQHREESFRTLAEALPDTVWTADAEGRIHWMNSVLPRASGLSRDDLLHGEGLRGLIHPDDSAATRCAWEHALRSGEPFDLEHRVRQADGSFRFHLVRVRPTHDTSGAVAGWIGTSTDIHDQREHQADLERRHEFEQHLVGIVSHDLRSPLSAILLGASALLDEEPDDFTTKIVQRIRSSAEWSVRMIRDLLDFTQARLGGGIKLEKRATNLAVLGRSVIDEVESTYPDRVLTLDRAGDTDGVWDADRIVQVVSNLVTNALKYSSPGSPVALRVTGQEAVVELTVHNEGKPIPPEQLGRLFEPLQRATDQIDRKTRSVGLGLYIVDSIVKAHGGTVGVVSTAEAGTTFTVRLPREQSAKAADGS